MLTQIDVEESYERVEGMELSKLHLHVPLEIMDFHPGHIFLPHFVALEFVII